MKKILAVAAIAIAIIAWAMWINHNDMRQMDRYDKCLSTSTVNNEVDMSRVEACMEAE